MRVLHAQDSRRNVPHGVGVLAEDDTVDGSSVAETDTDDAGASCDADDSAVDEASVESVLEVGADWMAVDWPFDVAAEADAELSAGALEVADLAWLAEMTADFIAERDSRSRL